MSAPCSRTGSGLICVARDCIQIERDGKWLMRIDPSGILRDLSILLRYIERLREDVIRAVEGEGPVLAFAELSVNSLDLDIEVSATFLELADVVARA